MKIKKRNNSVWILALTFTLIFLIRKCVKNHRYKKEILPIVEGMREQELRENAIVYGKKGTIYTLSNRDSVVASYTFYNGYRRPNKDSLDFYNILVKTPNGRAFTSRDTTVGQITAMLFKKPLDTLFYTNKKQDVKGIYFKPNSDKIINKNNRLQIIKIYTNDSTDLCFIADTFTKDINSPQHELAKKRLLKIKEQLYKEGLDSSKFKLKIH